MSTTRKELQKQIAYLRKLINDDALGDANRTLTKEINYLTFLLKTINHET